MPVALSLTDRSKCLGHLSLLLEFLCHMYDTTAEGPRLSLLQAVASGGGRTLGEEEARKLAQQKEEEARASQRAMGTPVT